MSLRLKGERLSTGSASSEDLQALSVTAVTSRVGDFSTSSRHIPVHTPVGIEVYDLSSVRRKHDCAYTSSVSGDRAPVSVHKGMAVPCGGTRSECTHIPFKITG